MRYATAREESANKLLKPTPLAGRFHFLCRLFIFLLLTILVVPGGGLAQALCGLRKQQNWDIQKMNRMNWIKGEDMITQ